MPVSANEAHITTSRKGELKTVTRFAKSGTSSRTSFATGTHLLTTVVTVSVNPDNKYKTSAMGAPYSISSTKRVWGFMLTIFKWFRALLGTNESRFQHFVRELLIEQSLFHASVRQFLRRNPNSYWIHQCVPLIHSVRCNDQSHIMIREESNIATQELVRDNKCTSGIVFNQLNIPFKIFPCCTFLDALKR